MVTRLLDEQLASAGAAQNPPATPAPAVGAEVPASTPVAARAHAKAGVVQLRYTLRNQSNGGVCVWDNFADEPAAVDLEYQEAWDQAERLNRGA